MIKLISMMKTVLEKLRISDQAEEFFNDDDDTAVVIVPPLSDDILVDILSRLPAEKVLECRRVCKHWNALTSTPHFTKKHLKVNADTAEPSIIIYYERLQVFGEGRHREVRVILFNEWGASTRKSTNNKIKRLSVKSIYPEVIYNSNVSGMRYYEDHGVLNFIPMKFPGVEPCMNSSFILYNPVTRQQMVLHTKLGSICAYFYHSVAEEYRVIWHRRSSNDVKVEYQILCLGSSVDKPSWRRLPDFDFAPFRRAIRTCHLNNEILHWVSAGRNGTTGTTECNTCLIMFDINKEEFSSMPHPGKLCTARGACSRHTRMFLLELKSRDDSLLCLCDCSTQDRIDMWVLEDIQKRTWVKRHRIILDFAIYRSPDIDHSNILIIPLGLLLNGELLINLNRLGVFVYNTSTRTLRRIIEILDGSIDFINDTDYIRHIGLFRKSLVSFTNFKGQHLIMEPY